MGTILVGDLNVHHGERLRLSFGTSPEGRRPLQLCQKLGLGQRVTNPIRDHHLLDLVLADFGDEVSTHVLPNIDDGRLVLCRMNSSLPASPYAPKRGYLLRRAM